MAERPGPEEAKLQRFVHWLQANGGELRGCSIKYCGPNKGFGVFATATAKDGDGVVMVVPLDLAITPMSVLQDPIVGPRCRAMFEEGDVDDRFLVMLFLTVERLRPESPWKPFLDMLPSTFGNPMWFAEDELAELKGTTLYRASLMQREKLKALYHEKVKALVEELLHFDGELKSATEVQFEDFLWANSIFWTRALSIPFPHSYVFPESVGGQGNGSVCRNSDSGAAISQVFVEPVDHTKGEKCEDADTVMELETVDETQKSKDADIVWVEGLVPGIDFCNHGVKAAATWEVDPVGMVTGTRISMYLMLADQSSVEVGQEINISYGNKGNEELLYLYGFVIDNNPEDYLMVHYPVEAFRDIPLSDKKGKLLELQNAELRCLLPRSLLDHGFFTECPSQDGNCSKSLGSGLSNYSWSGQRKVPTYLNKLVFPQDFLTALRTIAMQEHELLEVSSLLGELVGSGDDRQPSDKEVQAAVWETCGDYGALELLVDLLHVKMTELEEGSGTEACDAKILENCHVAELGHDLSCYRSETNKEMLVTRNQRSCIVYRRGQKQLTSLFLKEAEYALELCASEQS